MLTDKNIKVYFLGSGSIGIPVLKELIASDDVDLVGVGTQSDKAAGRKKKLMATPVGVFAEQNSLKLSKFDNVNDEQNIEYLRSLSIDIILVFSFGQILKQELISLPKIECLNIHTSLLPKYRGASPINAAILNGDEKTGVTFMKVVKKLDAGCIYKKVELPLSGNETYIDLENKLAALSSYKVVEVLNSVKDGSIEFQEQNESDVTFTGKICKSDGLVDWEESPVAIERKVRAYYPWPGAYFFLNCNGKRKKIQIASATLFTQSGSPGEVLSADKNSWIIACGDGSLSLDRVKPEGKNEMTGVEFLRGCRLNQGMNILDE